MYRDHTKVVHIGDRVIGGGNPVLTGRLIAPGLMDDFHPAFDSSRSELDIPGFVHAGNIVPGNGGGEQRCGGHGGEEQRCEQFHDGLLSCVDENSTMAARRIGSPTGAPGT